MIPTKDTPARKCRPSGTEAKWDSSQFTEDRIQEPPCLHMERGNCPSERVDSFFSTREEKECRLVGHWPSLSNESVASTSWTNCKD